MLKEQENIQSYSRLLRSALDAMLNTDDSSFSNSIGLKLTKNSLIVWLNEPSESILNVDFKDKIEQIASSILYPQFVVKHKAGLTLIPRLNEPPESARGLKFGLHYGIYKRLKIKNLLNDVQIFESNKNLAIALMQDYYWQPNKSPHLAIQAITRGGKTTFLRYLVSNCVAFSKMGVKNGSFDDGAKELRVIDPKLDGKLRESTLNLGGIYLSPDFSKNDNNFLDSVCSELRKVIDLMHSRAIAKKNNPNLKFKDVFLMIDEAISIPSSGNSKNRAIYMGLIDKISLMSASFQIHLIVASQSFLSGTAGVFSSQTRLEFSTKILLASKITAENAQFLFKELDSAAINNLILDEDEYGTLGVGIVTNGDGNIVPFKAPFIEKME